MRHEAQGLEGLHVVPPQWYDFSELHHEALRHSGAEEWPYAPHWKALIQSLG